MSLTQITVAVENTASGQGLLGEHGLAFWIEHRGRRILFDTGQGHVLKSNTHLLNIPLEKADAIVLSHGHFDHTGGLRHVLASGNTSVVFAHPAVLTARYVRTKDGTPRAIGMPTVAANALCAKAKLVWTDAPAEVSPGVYVTGPVPRQTDFEDAGGPFFVDPACSHPDEFPDDQALFFATDLGTVVVLGCAHAGVVNTLNYILELTDNRPIHMVIGGMHLVSASQERLNETVQALRRLDVQRLFPAHCTGFPATGRLWHEFPNRCAPCPVGTVVHLEN